MLQQWLSPPLIRVTAPVRSVVRFASGASVRGLLKGRSVDNSLMHVAAFGPLQQELSVFFLTRSRLDFPLLSRLG